MAKPRGQLRAVLIQIRDHLLAAEQEQECFRVRCRLDPGQMRVINLIHHPEIRWRDVADADVVMVGGAGGHSVTQTHAFTAPLREVVARLVAEDRPFFGSCWGHQFLAQVLGGTVVTDVDRKEVGTFPIAITTEGRRDPLLADLPPTFAVQLGHNDHIADEPPGIRVLASTERSLHQLIRVDGKPVYASQFHSEMNDDDMRARLKMYPVGYLNPDEVATFEAGLAPSPVADLLLDRFLTLYT